MVAHLLFGFVLAAGLVVGPPPESIGPATTHGTAGRGPSAVHPAFTRRRSSADSGEAPGECVHAIDRERAERPLGIVRA